MSLSFRGSKFRITECEKLGTVSCAFLIIFTLLQKEGSLTKSTSTNSGTTNITKTLTPHPQLRHKRQHPAGGARDDKGPEGTDEPLFSGRGGALLRHQA